MADKLKYEEKMVVDDRGAKYSPRLHPEERAARMKREEQHRMRCEAEERARHEEKMKAQLDERLQQRYQGWRELDAKAAEERRIEERKRLVVKEEEWFHRDERVKNEGRSRYNERTNNYDNQQFIGPADRPEVRCEIRPRPAHNGDGLYDLTKHRDSPAAHRSGPSGMMPQNAAKPPTQGRNQSGGEMNFSLYGYMPYNPMYISHEKLNHALASPAKEEASRTARQGPMAMPLDASDDAPGKPTSVIVEHRAPRHHQPAAITVDPYRCRGSITHGTAAGVKPMTTGIPLRQGGTRAASPLTMREEVSWSKKPTCVVNGLCWTGSQTLPSVARPLSPPNKVDLISQGLVPNPLYSSAAGGAQRSMAEVLPKLAVAGVDYAVDMSAKRTAVTRCDAPAKRSRCDDLLTAQWPPQTQGQGQGQGPPPPGSSYIDSFKSFVDHAVQSAFMDDAEKDSALRSAPLTTAVDGQTSSDQARPVTVGSILRCLNASPNIQSRNLAPSTRFVSASQSDPTLGVAGTEPGTRDGGAVVLPTSTTSVQPLSSPSQMPSLVASVGVTSTSPAAVNNGPPLLVPQCPIESVDDRAAADSPALSTTAGSDKVLGRGGGDTDSDTLSAHSPAPVLVPADATPPPTNAASSSLHLKKTWLLRYSDEDRKNATTSFDISAAGFVSSESYEKSQDGVGTDEKSSTEVWSTKQKQNSENDFDEPESPADAKLSKTGLEKQRQDLDKKASIKAVVGNCREVEDGKVSDGKDSIKNCFINCTYLSDKDKDARSLRRIVKDSGLEDKDAQSNTSKESDDSQSQVSLVLIIYRVRQKKVNPCRIFQIFKQPLRIF